MKYMISKKIDIIEENLYLPSDFVYDILGG